jgi:hypothetical protein
VKGQSVRAHRALWRRRQGPLAATGSEYHVAIYILSEVQCADLPAGLHCSSWRRGSRGPQLQLGSLRCCRRAIASSASSASASRSATTPLGCLPGQQQHCSQGGHWRQHYCSHPGAVWGRLHWQGVKVRGSKGGSHSSAGSIEGGSVPLPVAVLVALVCSTVTQAGSATVSNCLYNCQCTCD